MEKNSKSKINLTYIIFRIIILSIMAIYAIFYWINRKGNFGFIEYQLLLFFLFSFIPGLIEIIFKVKMPIFMKILFLFFCFCHFILGEIGGFYASIKLWDVFLHATTTSIITLLGISVIYILEKEQKIKKIPLFILIFPICFTMTIEVFWELIEFTSDVLFKTNMQRFNNSITGEPFIGQKALLDTMKDLIVDLLATTLVSLGAYLSAKKGNNTFEKWVITKKED